MNHEDDPRDHPAPPDEPPGGADPLAPLRREARTAVAAIVGLAGRLADPGLDTDARAAAAAAVRKHCRRLLRLLSGPAAAAEPPGPPRNEVRPRLLIAEDCSDSRKAVCSFLARAGFDVTPAENGRVAVALARSGGYDLVLLDMQMPEVDGYEAARQIRREGFGGPVIALTGDVRPGDEDACRDAGCDAYLAKPWEPDQLVGVLNFHLKGTRLGRRDDALKTTLRSDPALQQIARDFARTLPRTAAEVAAALAAGDRTRVARLAHQVAGAAGMFGYPDLCRACRQLEGDVGDGADGRTLEQRVRALEALTRRIVRGLGDGG